MRPLAETCGANHYGAGPANGSSGRIPRPAPGRRRAAVLVALLAVGQWAAHGAAWEGPKASPASRATPQWLTDLEAKQIGPTRDAGGRIIRVGVPQAGVGPDLTDAMLDDLGDIESLDLITFYLSDKRAFSQAGWERFFRRSNVRTLTFCLSRLDDDLLRGIGKSPTLRTIKLWYTKGVTSRSLAGLAGMKSLQQLNLFATDIDDAAIRTLVTLPDLEVLDVGVTAVGDPFVDGLAGLPRLRLLQIYDIKATGPAVGRLGRLPNLEGLKCEKTALAPADLRELAKAPKLRYVTLPDRDGLMETAVELSKQVPGVGFYIRDKRVKNGTIEP